VCSQRVYSRSLTAKTPEKCWDWKTSFGSPLLNFSAANCNLLLNFRWVDVQLAPDRANNIPRPLGIHGESCHTLDQRFPASITQLVSTAFFGAPKTYTKTVLKKKDASKA